MTLFLLEEGLSLPPEKLALVERLAWFMADPSNPNMRTLQHTRNFGGVDIAYLSADWNSAHSNMLAYALHTDDWCAVFYRKALWSDINPAEWPWGKHCYDGKLKGDYLRFQRDIIFAAMAI